MKKRSGKIIPFPMLKERLIEMGMDALNNKNYEEALELLFEARQWDSNHPEIDFGIAICFMELGDFVSAKQICKEMLHQAKGNYFQVLQMYLTILVQLGQYEEVEATIEAVLEENKLPSTHAEQFYKLLDLSRKMTEANPKAAEDEDDDLFLLIDKQLFFVQTLKNKSAEGYLDTIQKMLLSKTVHPIVKTMLLQLLRDQEISESMKVTKFGESIVVKPDRLHDLLETPFAKKVINLLDDVLGNENPTLFEAVKEMWIRHLYVMYPFQPIPDNHALWAASLHAVGYEVFGIPIHLEEVGNIYQVKKAKMTAICQKIRQIEEFSNIPI